MLCESCSEVTFRRSATEIKAYVDSVTLSKSATTGCELCVLVDSAHNDYHKRLAASPARYDFTKSPHRVKLLYAPLENDLSLWCDGAVHGHWIVGELFTTPGSVAADEISGRPLESHAATAANFARANEWLAMCTRAHEACGGSDEDALLPTRVLDLGRDPNDDRISLHISSPCERRRYAALSYCWGKVQQSRLLTHTISSMIEGIKVPDLSKTVQDAILVTRELGLRFLWVDALCIVQGDLDDWQRESASMASVYNGAYVTIQALNSDASHKGFLGPRTSDNTASAWCRYQTRDQRTCQIGVRHKPDRSALFIEPLNLRGWTLQEAILARRLLAYGTSEMSWQCTTCYCSESGNSVEDHETFVGLPKPIRSKMAGGSLLNEEAASDPRYQRYSTWAGVVEDYSRRALSYASDKLPAISGVASLLTITRKSDAYLAGMWRSDLPQSLAWMAGRGTRTRPAEYRAPSWSWAATDGEIEFAWSEEWADVSAYCKVLDASTTLKGDDRHGQVTDGKLVVEAAVKKGWRLPRAKSEADDKEAPTCQFFYGHPVVPAQKDESDLSLGNCFLDVLDPAEPVDVPVPTHFLRLHEYGGLALRQLESGSFERVGVVHLERYEHDPRDWLATMEVQEISIL